MFGEREQRQLWWRGQHVGRGSDSASASQDYTGAPLRFTATTAASTIYREEYGQGGVEYGDQPRGYDAGRDRDYGRAAYDRAGYGEAGYEDYPRAPSRRMARAGAGTGGYDYEQGYGDGGRARCERRDGRFRSAPSGSRTPGCSAGEFLHKAGERVASWFGGGGEARAFHDYERQDRGASRARAAGYKRLRRADQ